MAVTDLTGTTWVFNDEISNQMHNEAKINFISNNETFTKISFNYEPLGGPLVDFVWKMYYDTRSVSSYGSFPMPGPYGAYKIITITGGADATNSTLISWLQANGTLVAGYEVTFVTNGGTSVTKLENVEELPTPLPTTTKANHVFAGWYYDNLFTQKANAGDELTTNVTLYAKWYTPTTWCEDIADAIREKGGTTKPIKHLDFPERILAIDSGIDVSDANAVVGDVLTGKTFYAVDDTKKTGTMADNGTVNTDITTKAQEVTIQQGYHSGSGKVKISTTEQAKIVADNIKSGVTILGQAGAVTPAKAEETKTITTPDFSSGNIVVTPTTDKVMTQVTVNKDTTNHKSENIKDGITLYGVTGTYEGGGGSSNVTTWNFAEGYGIASGYVSFINENNEPQVLELSGTQSVKSIGPVGIYNSSIAQLTTFSEQLNIMERNSFGWFLSSSSDNANFEVMPKDGCTITLNSDD